MYGDDYMESLVIEKGEAMPCPRLVYKYPYSEMEVGDSFVVPNAKRQLVYNNNYKAGKRLGARFISKAEGGNIRVWRVA
jgi:hypothetical protein